MKPCSKLIPAQTVRFFSSQLALNITLLVLNWPSCLVFRALTRHSWLKFKTCMYFSANNKTCHFPNLIYIIFVPFSPKQGLNCSPATASYFIKIFTPVPKLFGHSVVNCRRTFTCFLASDLESPPRHINLMRPRSRSGHKTQVMFSGYWPQLKFNSSEFNDGSSVTFYTEQRGQESKRTKESK